MNSSLSNFSLSDCCKLLKKKLNTSNIEVKSYNVRPLDERKGYLGDYYYLWINYEYENKEVNERFFVKAKTTLTTNQEFLKENDKFSKECKFYQNLVWDIAESGVEIINECVPPCYLVSDDEHLIFEELEMQGYISLSARDEVSLDYLKSGLDALAKLHCSGIIFEEKMKEKLGQNFKLPQNYAEILKETFFARSKLSKRFIEAAKEAVGAKIDLTFQNSNDDIQRLKRKTFDVYDSFFKIVEPSTLYRNTICHGDLWSANLMNKFENGKVTHTYIIDFQMIRYGPPAQDVMTLLYITTSKKFRQEHMQNLIEYYYSKMSEILMEYGLCPTNILSYKEFTESCNYYRLFAYAFAMNHHLMIMFPEQEVMQKLVFEGRPKAIHDYWNIDDIYREKLKENITEFRDILIETNQL